MTSKLKRRLENIGIDSSSSSSKLNESFCLIGTPLPPLEKTKDTGEFKPLWEQEVRDEKGRRRLHGAFTGGWSAGYFNTAGSKEGWTPSTFVSSRSNRATKKEARLEDFMDEEDLEEMRASQKLVDASEPGALPSRAADAEDSISGALQNLIPPIEDSPGAKLLRKMGWRPGQGVGPRVSHAKLKRQDQLLAGPSAAPSRPDLPDDEASKHTFAPRDTQIPNYPPKGDAFGLGYARGPGLIAQAGVGSEKGPAGPKISAGFGLGAVNEADDDDLDVYDTGEESSSRRRMAFQEDEDEDMITLGPSTKSSLKRTDERNRSITSAVQSFHDGRPVPSGFVISAKPEIEDTWFKLPDIPKAWKPEPAKLWASQAAPPPKEENLKPSVPTYGPKGKGRQDGMSADKRGDILGEARLPAAPKSVFDYLSAKDRERLQLFAAKAKEAASGAATRKPSPPPPETIAGGEISSDLPNLHPSVAKAAMSGFQPFTSEPEKQARYDIFLKYHASPSPNMPYLARRPRQSEDEFKKELQDYAKAAMIFKPISGVMADRFRTAAVAQDVPKVVEALYYPAPVDGSEANAESEKEDDKEDADPKRQAARMGMYGPLTHETKEWRPVRLLCKRFGVPDPFMTKDGEGAAETASFGAGGSAPDPTSTTSVPPTSETSGSTSKQILPPPPAAPGRKDIANIGLGDDETQGQDTLTYQRPSMDIFKAIFASDSEDDSDNEENDEPMAAETKPGLQHESHEDSGSLQPALLSTTTVPMEVEEPQGPVDTSTFRPTFVSKAERGGRAEKDGSEKKDKKKKKAKPIVSFAADEDEGEASGLSIQPKKEKKRRRDKEKEKEVSEEAAKKARTEDGDTEMQWVEKEVSQPVEANPASVPPRKPGRKTAADFL